MFRYHHFTSKKVIAPIDELTLCIERLEVLINRVSPSPNRKRRLSSVRPKQFDCAEDLSPSLGDFISFGSVKEEDEFIEVLRRIAELVVLGEQKAATHPIPNSSTEEDDFEEGDAIALLELFYERCTLDLIIGIITGEAFRHLSNDAKGDGKKILSSSLPVTVHLPPISIAIQAIQTISILLQNVVRATSLYLLLSNNRIGSLISFSLDSYHSATKRNHDKNCESKKEDNPELQELTTHFISLLKSIALRINAETLQFFLSYPVLLPSSAHDSQHSSSDQVHFPLYARTLSFCSSHYDSFVRITAMNICMNLLRAISLQSGTVNAENSMMTEHKVPDAGSLCTLPPISLRDRLGIAKFVCSPMRVGKLMASIFFNIATACRILEENIRALFLVDENIDLVELEGTKSGDENEDNNNLLREQSDIIKYLRNVSADLEDELLLLNDILKVGIICLNEQIVEMFLSTIVYPLLLQPLYSWSQSNQGHARRTFNNISPNGTRLNNHDNLILSHACMAIYASTVVFRTVTHKPVLHLLFTALCHPRMPQDSSSCVVIRTLLEGGSITTENGDIDYYQFNQEEYISLSRIEGTSERSTKLVYVLSPALSALFGIGLLRSNAGMIDTKANLYRIALFESLTISNGNQALLKVSVHLIDAILIALSYSVVNRILFGSVESACTTDLIYDECDVTSLEIITSLYSSLLTTRDMFQDLVSYEFDPTVAHAILCATSLNESTYVASKRLINAEYEKSMLFMVRLSHILIDKVKMLASSACQITDDPNKIFGIMLYTIIFGPSFGNFTCLLELLVHNSNDQPCNCEDEIFVHIANESTMGDVSAAFPDRQRRSPIQLPTLEDLLVAGVSSVMAFLKVATLANVLNRTCTRPTASRIAVHKSVAHVLDKLYEESLLKYTNYVDSGALIAQIPDKIRAVILADNICSNGLQDSSLPASGVTVSFVGKVTFPCVCEVTQEFYPLIKDKASCILADGIYWLSLYLVLYGNFLVLAEPDVSGSSGDGLVLSSCRLLCIQVSEDNPIEISSSSPARRLVLRYSSFSPKLPDMFALAPKEPVNQSHHLLSFCVTSTLDLWFENAKAAKLAFHTIRTKIEKVRSQRGCEIYEALCLRKLDDLNLDLSDHLYESPDRLDRKI